MQIGSMRETIDMRSQTEHSSPRRALLLTLIILVIVANGIPTTYRHTYVCRSPATASHPLRGYPA
jgi:hypothetical protein